MGKKSAGIFLAILMSICFLLPGAPAFSDQVQWPHEKSDLKPDPAIIFGRLENGLSYALMQNTEPKNRVSVKLAIKAGALHEREDQRGLAHYLEHMAFNGSEHFKPGELVEYFQSIGMRFGNDLNAHTGFDETVYQLLLPKGDKDDLDKGLTVMADYAGTLLLLPEEIDRERGVILAEKTTRDSVGYRTFEESLKFFTDNARVSQRLPIGTEEVIKAADQALLKDYYDAWYRPDNMLLVLVGDFEPDVATPIIREKFSGIQPRAALREAPGPGEVSHEGLKTFYHHEKEAPNTDVSLEATWTVKHRPDSFDKQKELLLERMANIIVKHRLDALKEKPDCPFTDAGISSGRFLKTLAYSSISAECAPENWEKSLEVVEQSLRQALKYGFTKDEVERVKKELTAQLDNAVAKASTRNSERLARLIYSNWIGDEVFMSPAQEKDLFGPVVEKASRRSLKKALRRNWPDDHMLALVTGNAVLKKEGLEPEEFIAQVYEKSLKTKISRPSKKKAAEFPYLPAPAQPGKIKTRTDVEDLGVVQVVFENGVSLNIKQTDFKADEIVASLRFCSGRADEPEDKPGLGSLAPAVINESGLGAMTKDELQRAFAGKSTSTGLHAGENAFFIKGSTIPRELELFFQLLRARIVDPGFRRDAYDRAMERFDQMYEGLSHTVEGAMKLHAVPFLGGGDSRFGNPPKHVFMSLTLEDVKNWMAPCLASAPLELSIVGDLDVEKTIELAALYLGSLEPRTGSESKRDRTVVFPKGQSRTFEVDTKIDKAIVLVVYPTADIWDISRTRRLNVLGDVLSDRLRHDVREKLGLTYSPQAWNHPYRAYPGFGYMTCYLSVDSASVDKVAALARDIAGELAKTGATQDELHRALEPTVTGIKDLLRKNPYWLNTVLSGASIHPQKLEWRRTILQDYESITAQDVTEKAAQYLVDENAAVVILKPAKND